MREVRTSSLSLGMGRLSVVADSGGIGAKLEASFYG